MTHLVFRYFRKLSIFLVYVQVIAFKEVVRNINIGPIVIVHVADRNAQPEADQTAINASLLRYVLKTPFSCVVKKFLPRHLVTQVSNVLVVYFIDGIRTVFEQKHIQVAVAVVVKKSGVRRVPLVVEAVFSGFIPKSQVAIVYKQFVGAVVVG